MYTNKKDLRVPAACGRDGVCGDGWGYAAQGDRAFCIPSRGSSVCEAEKRGDLA